MIDQFLKTNHAFCAKVQGVMRIETCRGSEREVKYDLLMANGVLTCLEPDCNCVDRAWENMVKPGVVEIVAVTIEEGVKVE